MVSTDDKPFRYLTQTEFLALTEMERIAYIQRVNDRLALRIAEKMGKAEKPEKS